MNYSMEPEKVPIGMVGLGLMGSSITVCMLIAGHPVIGVEPVSENVSKSLQRVREYLDIAWQKGLVSEKPDAYLARLTLSDDFDTLGPAMIVI